MKLQKLTRVKDAELILCLNRGYYWLGMQGCDFVIFLREGPAKRWAKQHKGRTVHKMQAGSRKTRDAVMKHLKDQHNLEVRA